jgi:phosphoribosylanthranilate isomerase
MTRTRIKICGITRREDALAAAQAGADAIGLVLCRGTPRSIGLEQAAAIVAGLPPFVTLVGLFVDPQRAEVEAALAALPLGVLQFHGAETPQFCASFGRGYVKALRMRPGVDLLDCALRFQAAGGGFRGLVLDAHVEGVPGGAGVAFDWSLVPATAPVPLVLSGGLRPDNVAEAVRRLRPGAVDVSSGVEPEGGPKGIKDAARIAAFVREVRNADG